MSTTTITGLYDDVLAVESTGDRVTLSYDGDPAIELDAAAAAALSFALRCHDGQARSGDFVIDGFSNGATRLYHSSRPWFLHLDADATVALAAALSAPDRRLSDTDQYAEVVVTDDAILVVGRSADAPVFMVAVDFPATDEVARALLGDGEHPGITSYIDGDGYLVLDVDGLVDQALCFSPTRRVRLATLLGL